VDNALKTSGNIYLNVETSLFFPPPIKISDYVPAHNSPTIGLNLRALPPSAVTVLLHYLPRRLHSVAVLPDAG